MPFVSVTRLRLRSVRFLPAFIFYTLRSQSQAKRADGVLSVKVGNAAQLAFWTLTVWRDEAAMRAFMVSGPHKTAMPKLMEWCDEASVTHWNQDSADAPSWAVAHQRMVQEGRLSKVRYPSTTHERLTFPPPQ